MRVVAVSPVAHYGGAEVLLLDVLAGLSERGHASLLISCGGDDEGDLAHLAKERGVEVSAAPAIRLRDPLSMLAAAAHLRSVARAFAADVLHCNHPHGGLVGLLARVGRPLSVQLLDPAPARDPAALAMAMVRADFISISDTTTDAYRPRLHRARSLTTVRPGRDLDGFRAAATAGDPRRVLLNAGLDSAASPLVVMVGRLQGFKGIFRMIEVSCLVPDVTFVHIGPDAPTELGTRARARAAIDDRGLAQRVGLAGAVSLADLAATVARADLLLHLAEGETFGLVLVEAMAVGTPPVATVGPGPSEILRNGGGVLLSDGAPATVAAAVRSLLSDRRRLADVAEEARDRSSAFALGCTIDAYEVLFARSAGIVTVRS